MSPKSRVGSGALRSPAPAKLQASARELSQARRRIASLEAQNQELRATSQSYMETLGFVAHELKNALASAVLSLYTVKDGYLGDVTPAQRKSLETVAGSLEDLADMLRNYLDLSRLEQGEMRASKTHFPLNDRVVLPLLDELGGEAERKQMAIDNGIPDGKVVYADAALLKVVFRNLLSNAIKYGRPGGEIRLRVEEDGETATLSVANDGIGIEPDQIPLLFVKFRRLYRPEHASQRGTGLGLYICRQIVEKHGGSIWAESRVGEWVKFSFSLPRGEVR